MMKSALLWLGTERVLWEVGRGRGRGMGRGVYDGKGMVDNVVVFVANRLLVWIVKKYG